MRRQTYLVTGKGRQICQQPRIHACEFSFSRGGVVIPLGQALLEFPEKFKIFLGRGASTCERAHSYGGFQEGERSETDADLPGWASQSGR